MNVWVCGQYLSGEEIGKVVWDFQGIFSTKEVAIKACRNKNYFIAPAELDEVLPDENEVWPGVEYPLA